MELSDYVFSKRWVTRDELKILVSTQFYRSIPIGHVDEHGLFPKVSGAGEPEWTYMRRPPFGLALDATPHTAQAIYKRAGVANLEELVAVWHRDLVAEMECLGNYSTACRCARNLFLQRSEKKIVARCIVNSGRPNSSLVRQGDTVAIMEGSSSFFVSYAIAAKLRNCSIVSSNGILNAEYLHNLWIAKAFRSFQFVGGAADFNIDRHVPEHAGVFGHQAELQFEAAIRDNPPATVIVIPCSGILPGQGPFATTGDVQGLKLNTLRCALERNVREIIFISDYSKMLPSREAQYGTPVCERDEWRKILKTHGDKISIVTTPPDVLRNAISARKDSAVHPYTRKLVKELYPGINFAAVDFEYNAVAAEFAKEISESHGARFVEAIDLNPTLESTTNSLLATV